MFLSVNKSVILGSVIEKISKISSQEQKDLPKFLEHTLKYLNDNLRDKLNRSEYTISSVKSSLSSFVRYAVKVRKIKCTKLSFLHCNSEFINEWLTWELQYKKVSNATRNVKLGHLREYVFYATTNIDPLVGSIYLQLINIPLLKVNPQEKIILTSEQVAEIAKAALNQRNGKRNAMMILLLFAGAFRSSELLNVRLNDIVIKSEQSYIHVTGKGKRERNIIIPEDILQMLKAYIRQFHSKSSEETPLFYSLHKGKAEKLCVRSLENIIQEAGDLAKKKDPSLQGRIHPHAFRRAKATELYRNNTPIELVSAYLGHSSTEVTSIYAIPSPEQIKKAIDNCNFAEEWKNAEPEYSEDEFNKMIIKAGLSL
jgi:integrase